MELSLDGSFVFKGEIARACGGVMGGTEAFGDVSKTSTLFMIILFIITERPI